MPEAKVEVGWGANAVKTGLKELRDDLRKTREEFNEGYSVGKLLAIGAAVEFVREGIMAMVEEAGQLADLSGRFGVAASSLQRIGNATKEDGVALEGLATSMNKLLINQAKAKQGDEEQAKALTDLGIDVQEFINLNAEEAFYKIADGVKEAKDPLMAYNSVVTILGKSAGALIPTLQKGGEEIRSIGNAAGVMSDETIENLDAAADKWESVMHRIKVMAAESFLFISRAAQQLGVVIGAVINSFNPNVGPTKAGRIYDEQMKEIFAKKEDAGDKPVRDLEAGKEAQAALEKQKKEAEDLEKIYERIDDQQKSAFRDSLEGESKINDLIMERELLYAKASGVHSEDAKKQAEDWLKAGELEKQIVAEREKVDREQEAKQQKFMSAREKYQDKVFEGSLAQMSTEEQIKALLVKKKELTERIAEEQDLEKSYDMMGQLEDLQNRILKLATPKEDKETERLVTSSLGRLSGGGAYLSKADPAVQQTEAIRKGNELLQDAKNYLKSIEEKVGKPLWQ